MQTNASNNTAHNFTETLQHEGIERTVHIHLPTRLDESKPAPLVIALHGGGEGSKFDLNTNHTLTNAAASRGCILVLPEGIDKKWNDGRPEIFRSLIRRHHPHDDVGFISKLIDTLIEKYAIDPARVYVTSISNGGFLSIRLAMELSHKIAAIVPVTAQLTKAMERKKPEHPISVMIINGTDDPLVPYEGGAIRLGKRGRCRGEILSTEATIEFIRKHNQCEEQQSITDLPNKAPSDGITATLSVYPNGRSGTEVRLIKVTGGGHGWPGGQQYLAERFIGTVSRDFDASEMIFEFFFEAFEGGIIVDA